MKTIDEHYKDWFGESHLSTSNVPTHDSAEACDFAKYYFDKMTDWIPVDESVPEHHPELLLKHKGNHLEITKPVLVKYDDGRFSIDCRRNAGDLYNFWKIDHSGIIGWKPIELK